VKGSLRDPEEDLKLAVLPSCLGITVLGCPPLLEEMPGVVAVVGIEGVRQQVQRRGSIKYGIGGLIGPGKRMKAIIQDEPINKLEVFITMSRRYRSHLMRRRRWFTGMSSSGISSTAHLPQLSSPAMKLIGSTRREEGCCRVLRGRRSAKEQERLQVSMCSRPEPSAGI